MSIIEIGCCDAYCKTCRAFADKACKGCKLGYDDGERDIDKARCKIKACCLKEKNLKACADCPDLISCKIMQAFYNKKGYKYKKYKEAIEFIRENGYDSFLKSADRWNGAYGKIEKQ